MTVSYGATTTVVGTWISSRLRYYAIPGVDVVEPLPWWAYAAMVLGLALAGGVIRLELLHYRSVQVGKLVPNVTVAMLVAAKDAEIERLTREVERWNVAYHVTNDALVELSQTVDENTDALRALIPGLGAVRQIEPPTRTTNNTEAANARPRRERSGG